MAATKRCYKENRKPTLASGLFLMFALNIIEKRSIAKFNGLELVC